MKNLKDKTNLQIGLHLFSQLTGWIVIPIILAVIAGKWLDRKFETTPWLFLATIGIAFVISNIGIAKQALRAMKKIEKEAKQSNKKKDS